MRVPGQRVCVREVSSHRPRSRWGPPGTATFRLGSQGGLFLCVCRGRGVADVAFGGKKLGHVLSSMLTAGSPVPSTAYFRCLPLLDLPTGPPRGAPSSPAPGSDSPSQAQPAAQPTAVTLGRAQTCRQLRWLSSRLNILFPARRRPDAGSVSLGRGNGKSRRC